MSITDYAMQILLEEDLQQISRRSFLKLTGSSLLALFTLPSLGSRLPAADTHPALLPPLVEEITTFGRVLNNRATLRKKPSFNAEISQPYKNDMVIPITGLTLGEDPTDYNRIWYRINNDEGYVYSGNIQPVEVRNNPVAASISKEGQLAEVTVPFTNAHWRPNTTSGIPYRFYYSTTHWVFGVEQDQNEKKWYSIHDDKKGYDYYVDATHLRLIPPAEIAPISPQIPSEDKRLEVHLSDQVLIAYEGDRPVFMTRTATGAHFRDGDYRTPKGTFHTNRKRASRHMAVGEPGIGSGFDLPGVPWVSYLTESGVSLHGTYWHNDFGRTRSHGCINLSPTAARWVFRWTLPSVPAGQEVWEDKNATRVVIS